MSQDVYQAVVTLGKKIDTHKAELKATIHNVGNRLKSHVSRQAKTLEESWAQSAQARQSLLTLREVEDRLQRLYDDFWRCYWETEQAKLETRALKDDEYKAIAKAWEDCRRAYRDMEASLYGALSALEMPPRWAKAISDLETSKARLDDEIEQQHRRTVLDAVADFKDCLLTLQAIVGDEFSRRCIGGEGKAGQ